jgi:hypothetical protein
LVWMQQLQRSKTLSADRRRCDPMGPEVVADYFRPQAGQGDVVGEVAAQVAVPVDFIRNALQPLVVQRLRQGVQNRNRLRTDRGIIEPELDADKDPPLDICWRRLRRGDGRERLHLRRGNRNGRHFRWRGLAARQQGQRSEQACGS